MIVTAVRGVERWLMAACLAAIGSYGFVSESVAQPTKPSLVQKSALVMLRITVGRKSKNVFCWGREPGRIREARGRVTFFPTRYDLKRAKSKVKAQPSDRAARAKVRSLTSELRVSSPACTASVATPTPAPTPDLPQPTLPLPTATSTPVIPIATPTPDPKAIFDASGNVTIVGKQYLGIPSNLNANIDQGALVQSFSCVGCHIEKTNRSYPYLLSRIPQDPMYIQVPSQISFQALADLTAYLNRFQVRVP